MMLIALTILLPLMHSVAGTECQAVEFKVVHTSSLPGPIKEQLQKDGYTLWDDQTSLGVYYKGFPDVTKSQKVQFMAGCAVGLKDRAFRYCVNATAIDGVLGGHKITEDAFQNFYKACHNDPLPNLNELKVEEEDDMDMAEKDELEEELQDLEQAAKGN